MNHLPRIDKPNRLQQSQRLKECLQVFTHLKNGILEDSKENANFNVVIKKNKEDNFCVQYQDKNNSHNVLKSFNVTMNPSKVVIEDAQGIKPINSNPKKIIKSSQVEPIINRCDKEILKATKTVTNKLNEEKIREPKMGRGLELNLNNIT